MDSIADYSNCIASQLSLPAQVSRDLPSKSHDQPVSVATCQCELTCGGPCSQQAEDRHGVCDGADNTASSQPLSGDGHVEGVVEKLKEVTLSEAVRCVCSCKG